MRIIRFRDRENTVMAAITDDHELYRLEGQDFTDLIIQAENKNVSIFEWVSEIVQKQTPLPSAVEELKLLVPVKAPEVWAAGVTYQRSREARNFEATDGKMDVHTFYDKVYAADRPEIFFKSTAARTVGTNDTVYIRSDSDWQVPESELGLVLSRKGDILGYTIGNDMSCRDIEGENPLYLPQAKIWRNSCSIGPAIRLIESVKNPYELQISCRIFRNDVIVFEDTANTNQLKRRFDELVSYLAQDNILFDGTVLLTGTCIVPPEDFTLLPKDRIEIEIPEIGILTNIVGSNLS
ncbi:2-dehydro-3-deoxy-D-arabinonate dehydratase [Seinonella peptonophila]|uniref:2-dehydro-3-deoxy-D-arabinonate dehydratase n=1 Tax=Seinonella peptonophila TaxID=112248 RepID=A0A1M4T334_9BACL|nr:fumarylacetoacetate hydrolase family protein [Seinonella peptonophila]SHE38876.1 2-dehydro-3-deoxy-D-arabinonate dehydratase [Seinonella peptonophila]